MDRFETLIAFARNELYNIIVRKMNCRFFVIKFERLGVLKVNLDEISIIITNFEVTDQFIALKQDQGINLRL